MTRNEFDIEFNRVVDIVSRDESEKIQYSLYGREAFWIINKNTPLEDFVKANERFIEYCKQDDRRKAARYN